MWRKCPLGAKPLDDSRAVLSCTEWAFRTTSGVRNLVKIVTLLVWSMHMVSIYVFNISFNYPILSYPLPAQPTVVQRFCARLWRNVPEFGNLENNRHISPLRTAAGYSGRAAAPCRHETPLQISTCTLSECSQLTGWLCCSSSRKLHWRTSRRLYNRSYFSLLAG